VRLLITTPDALIVSADDVIAVTAEDASGAFGILPGHADLVTALEVSVMSWVQRDSRRRYCALRGGVLHVRDGSEIAIATPEALIADDLERLDIGVLEKLCANVEEERAARAYTEQLRLRAMRQILTFLRPQRRSGMET
jgi:F-type H+-transporting ATPase subunit epsilon